MSRLILEQLQALVVETVGGLAGSTLGIVLLSACALLYFLPPVIASLRRHNNTVPIFLVTLFWGWTVVGWMIALTWSFTDNTSTPNDTEKEASGNGADPPADASAEPPAGDEDEAEEREASGDVPFDELAMTDTRVLVTTGLLSAAVVVLALTTLYFWWRASNAHQRIARIKAQAQQEKEKYLALREDRIHEHTPGLEKFEGDDFKIDVDSLCLGYVSFDPDRGKAKIRWINRARKSLKPSLSVDLYNQWGGKVGTLRSSWTFRSIHPGEADVETQTLTTDGDFLYYDLDLSCT